MFGQDVVPIVLGVTDDKSLPKEVPKQAQIDNAPPLSREAKIVQLADKICHLRDILAALPADWSAERKRDYFSWVGKVVAGIQGVHPQLEAVFDALVERQREIC